jgi:type IV secretion system protein TrbL
VKAFALFPSLAGSLAEYATNVLLRAGRWCRSHKFKGVLLVLAVACSFAGAQSGSSSGPPPVSSYGCGSDFSTPDTTVCLIASTVQSSLNTLTNNAKLQAYGNYLTGFFLISMLVWGAVKTLAASRGIGELLGEWVPVFVSFGIVYIFLNRDVGSEIVATMDGIASAIGGANMSTLQGAITTGAQPIFSAISNILETPASQIEIPTGWAGALTYLAMIGSSIVSILMGAIMKLIACLALVIVGVIMASHIIMGFMSIQLALALAPVMVPFLMFRPASWLFDGWLKFLLGACMLKIVVAFLLVMIGGLMSGMFQLSVNIKNDVANLTPAQSLQVDILMFGMMMVFAILAALLMHQAPAIASGLLSGNAGSVGFGGIKPLTQSMGNRVLGGNGGGPVRAVGAVAGATARGARYGGAYALGRWGEGKGAGLSKAVGGQSAYSRGAAAAAKQKAPGP